jgi:hypothetical protein
MHLGVSFLKQKKGGLGVYPERSRRASSFLNRKGFTLQSLTLIINRKEARIHSKAISKSQSFIGYRNLFLC